MKGKFLKELLEFTLPENIITEKEFLAPYIVDAAQWEVKSKMIPLGVVFPITTEQVSRIMKLCTKYKIPVFPRGAGSGLTGGAVPTKEGIILSFEKMNRILEINPIDLFAAVEPGLITNHLNLELNKYRLFYPAGPVSSDFSTIGGNIASNAGGIHSLKYGTTKDYVLALEYVLINGDIGNCGALTFKSNVGYDLTRLLVGCEGTLAVITKAILKVLPLPEKRLLISVFFDEIDPLINSIYSIVNSGIVPETLEFLDKFCLQSIKNYNGFSYPKNAKFLLIIGIDGDEKQIDFGKDKICKIINSSSINYQIACDEDNIKRIDQIRSAISPAMKKIKPDKIDMDVVVLRSKLKIYINWIDQISMRYQLPIALFGHIGDGTIHTNILYDKTNLKEKNNIEKVLDELVNAIADIKGSISGEHGIGITKKKFIEKQLGKVCLENLKNIKRLFDPNNLLNPGKIFN